MQPSVTAPPPAGPRQDWRLTGRLTLIALATIALVIACDKVPLTSPTGSTIALSIDRNILPVNGVATVVAVVTESAGTPVHNGTTVTFQTSLGRMEPVEAQTLNGKATTTFHAGSQSGTAAIHAFSGSARTGSGNSSAGGVSVLVGSAALGSVTMTVSPSTVPQAGGTVNLAALVLDTSANPLPSVAVLFNTEHGTLASNSVVSDSRGIAANTLTTNRATRVTARVADKESGFNIGVLAPPLVTIAATGTNHVVGIPVAFTVTPNTSGNASPIQTVVVEFGDGGTHTQNNPTGPYGLTHNYSRADGYTVTATATDINGQRGGSSTAIVVTRLLPTVTVTMNPNSPVANQQVAFTITASPATNGPPVASVVATADGVQVYSGTSSGAFFRSFPSGPHIIEATVTDSAGSVGRTTLAFNVP